MRRLLAALAEVLDWWRVYVSMLVSFVIAGLVVGRIEEVQSSLALAGGTLLVGVVAGVLWQARAGRA
jgi:hypothetical protein